MASRPITSDEETVERHIGARIRSARRDRKVSQQVLSEKIGVDRATIAKYEKGQARLLMVRLLAIATSLDMPLTYFVCDLPVTSHRPPECTRD